MSPRRLKNEITSNEGIILPYHTVHANVCTYIIQFSIRFYFFNEMTKKVVPKRERLYMRHSVSGLLSPS